MRRLVCLVLASLLAACQTPPNTPGAGVGRQYTPVIDLQGVDQTRYFNDLNSCRSSASMVDAERAEMAGLIGGALIGAAIGASISSDRRVISSGANSGALSGGLRAGGRARSRQEIIMGNCMSSRGYRVLDGTANVSFVQPFGGYAPAPAVASPPAPMQTPEVPAVALPTVVAAPLVTAAALPPPPRYADGRPATPGVLAITETSVPKATPAPSGQDAYQAEQLARRMNCAFSESSSLVGKGPGYETYGVRCGNGETIVIRCEFGNCRALR
jgi:hypothetical protein